MTPRSSPHLIGMTIALPRNDLEAACTELKALGFGGVEVFVGQLGPGIVDVPVRRAHAAAAGEIIRELELAPVMLNAIDGHFDPIRQPEPSAERLAEHLQLAAAMDMPRILTWDGILPAGASANAAPRALADCIEAARERSGLPEPPTVSVELHPFTFALADGLLEETAAALLAVGAGLCIDFCHFGVALGPTFAEQLTGNVLDAVNHVHWCDTDCETSELHFPPGAGVLDLGELDGLFAGRSVEFSWDLFAWPAPRAAMTKLLSTYSASVMNHRASLKSAT